MAGTKIKQCTCKHDFQDAEYGKGNRLHNLSNDKKTAYCTVCCLPLDSNGRIIAKINPTNQRYIKTGKPA